MSGITLLNLMVLTGFLMFVEPTRDSSVHKDDKVQELIGLLNQLAEGTDQNLLKMHFESVATMISDQTHDAAWTAQDSARAAGALVFFQNEGALWETYANGPRPLIISFNSPSDGKNSFYWLFLPKEFDPQNSNYSFYMELHGSGGGKNDNPRNMLLHPLQPEIMGVTAQGYRQEGLFIYPWARGDKWYKDQAALDISECLAHFDELFTTDSSRQYLYGFSMGGAGVYTFAQQTHQRWSALGIYSGAFRDGVSQQSVEILKNMPVWITWGETERLAEGNKQLRDYLLEAGAEVNWQEVPDVGHSYLGEYQEDLMDWFLDHEK